MEPRCPVRGDALGELPRCRACLKTPFAFLAAKRCDLRGGKYSSNLLLGLVRTVAPGACLLERWRVLLRVETPQLGCEVEASRSAIAQSYLLNAQNGCDCEAVRPRGEIQPKDIIPNSTREMQK